MIWDTPVIGGNSLVLNSEEPEALPHILSAKYNGAQTFPGSVLQGNTCMEDKESACDKQDIKQDFGEMTQETGINESSRHLNEFLIKIQIGKKKREAET